MAGTFHESWYRVAPLRVALRPTVRFRKHNYRGAEWYVLEDPFTGAFFRLSPTYYRFVCRLSFQHTLEELWVAVLEADPDYGPGQQEIIHLLVQLHGESLIYFQDPLDNDALFLRREQKQQSGQSRWLNILFLRIPLWNPEAWLSRLLPLWKRLFSVWGMVVWVLVVGWGVKLGVEHAREFSQQAMHILTPGNLFYLYIGIALIKTLHEVGHAALCKYFGGEVSTIGVMLLIFAPLPYMDASSAWAFPHKWHRILVSSGGVLVELFVGALACMVWVASPPGVVHAVAYNMTLTATVSTLLFNANPLMRYDGYYVLADMIEVPNLMQRSRDQLYSLAKRYILGLKVLELPARSWSEGSWLVGYGVLSVVYRLVLFVGIALFLADRYLLLGELLAVSMVFFWFVRPPIKLISYLARGSELQGVRRWAVSRIGLLLLPLLLLLFVPLPMGYTFPAVVESDQVSDVLVRASGRVESFFQSPGAFVPEGTELVQLRNEELAWELDRVQAQLSQLEVVRQQALHRGGVDTAPLQKRYDSLQQALAYMQQRQQDLLLRAEHDGVWNFFAQQEYLGQWLSRGQALGCLVGKSKFRILGIVNQEKASDIFASEMSRVEVRLKGRSEYTLLLQQPRLLPHAQETLPCDALGWQGGGEIPVNTKEGKGRHTLEPFYMLQAQVSAADASICCHGQTGIIFVTMPPKSLAWRAIRFLRQFFQQRYHV